jgi:hypothetical protein
MLKSVVLAIGGSPCLIISALLAYERLEAPLVGVHLESGLGVVRHLE